jgi:hypothetical protein
VLRPAVVSQKQDINNNDTTRRVEIKPVPVVFNHPGGQKTTGTMEDGQSCPK